MKVIKRSGEEVIFNVSKIENAIRKANAATTHNQLTEQQILAVAESVALECEKMNRAPNVEEIQDIVEADLMSSGFYAVAKNYITYRYERALVRKANSTDKQIMSLLERNNEEVKQENSNKNPLVNSVQRDYMAGEVSKDITRRFYFRMTLWKLTTTASFISMIQTILPSTCITAVWSTSKTCSRMEQSFLKP